MGAVPIRRQHPDRPCTHHRHASMVDVCYNPECKKELRYLREGRVVRIIHGDGDEARLEHFWLCGHCSQIYEFVFPSDGPVGLKVRGSQFTLDSIRATSFPARLTGIEGAQQTPQQN